MKLMKKLLASALSVMLGVAVLASCTTPTDPTTANPTTGETPTTQEPSSETPSTQLTPDEEKIIYVKVEDDVASFGWTGLYAHSWGGDVTPGTTWPGTKMTEVATNIYSIELPKGHNTVVFNINGSPQTVNIPIVEGYNAFVLVNKNNSVAPQYATYDGSKFTVADVELEYVFYVRGTMNNWGESADYKLEVNANRTEATLTVALQEGDMFKVATGSWNPEFNALSIELPAQLTNAGGSDNNIKVVESATFTFTITNPDEDNRVLTITVEPAA